MHEASNAIIPLAKPLSNFFFTNELGLRLIGLLHALMFAGDLIKLKQFKLVGLFCYIVFLIGLFAGLFQEKLNGE